MLFAMDLLLATVPCLDDSSVLLCLLVMRLNACSALGFILGPVGLL